MRFSGFVMFLVLSALLLPQATRAEEPPKEVLPDYERVYLENAKDMNQSVWEQDTWSPEGWTDARGSSGQVIKELYRGGIITGQYEDAGQPVLEVGRNFLRLSDIDKRRVVAYVDHVYGITSKSENGMFLIQFAEQDKSIGIYTKYGLQIQ